MNNAFQIAFITLLHSVHASENLKIIFKMEGRNWNAYRSNASAEKPCVTTLFMKNEVLFQKIKALVASERRIGIEILECLYEVEKRRAYFDLRYDGLFTYCVKELGFTESQAFQRIRAMSAVKEVPELKPMIANGSLSVSAISKVQNHFRKEKKSGKKIEKTEKRDLFLSMEGKTFREVEVSLAQVRGEKLKEKLVLEMDEELAALWKQAKDLAAHRSRGEATEVLKILARDWIHRNHPASKGVHRNAALLG